MAPAPGPQRLETLITRVTLGGCLLIAAAALAAIVLATNETSPRTMAARLAIPIVVGLGALLAFGLARVGRPRSGVAFLVLVSYASIVNYLVVSNLGLHSHTVALLAALVMAASLLIGRRAGLAATAVALATMVVLFVLEERGLLGDAQAVRAMALTNILIAEGALVVAVGAVLVLFSQSFHETLRDAEVQEQRFRRLIEVAPLGYLLHRDGSIVLANRVAAAFLGRASAERLRGEPLQALLPALTGADSTVGAVDCLQPGADGDARLLQAETRSVEASDGPALLTVLRDVTEERAASRAMAEARAQAEAASRAKSDFVANMSHEIRTPLNAIVGLAELARQRDLDPRVRDGHLAKIGVASQALLEIVSDILDVSKIEAGALRVEQIDFDPRCEIGAVQQMHADRAADKGVALSLRAQPALPPLLRGDPVRLRQVANNFVSNALKFTTEGSVELRLLWPRDGWLRLEVADTGVGIDAATLARLFEPFAQADSSTTRRYGGTGLGLALCRSLAQLMGGQVGVESQPGRGSLFWAELPMPAGTPAREQPLQRESGSPDAGALDGARVLLVEDNELNRLVACELLRRLGVEAVVAGHGRAAIEHFDALACPDCDAVLMDIQMPEMDGFEATRALRRRFDADALPIIAMTAAAFAEDRERCLDAGMNDFVAKPFETRRLEAVLRRWIRRAPTRTATTGMPAGLDSAPRDGAAAPAPAASRRPNPEST